MQMIYNQQFTLRQYGAWLAMNRACFQAIETPTMLEELKDVHKPHLLRTKPLEADLSQLLGASWLDESEGMASSSKATQQYLSGLKKDAETPKLLLAHHFLVYNAVLSGGAYLGEMVSQKFAVPHGTPGVQFYAFDGVKKGMGAGEVQRYIQDFNRVSLSEEDKQHMLKVMLRVYDDMEGMMTECFDINPQSGVGYAASKEESRAPPAKLPEEELLHLSLLELSTYIGTDDSRIIMSIAGELLDISAGRDMYGPGCGYSLFAGRDVTKCLGTASLDHADLDDLDWEPGSEEDQAMLENWREKLKAKYPVAGSLKRDSSSKAPSTSPEGLRQRAPASPTGAAAAAEPLLAAAAPAADGAATEKCPISGKEGVGCPMAMFGVAIPKAKAKPKSEPAKTGFMKGKSMIAAVSESKGEGESWIYKLCPLHWDENTTRLLLTVAAAAWVSGVFVGWNLNRQYQLWMAS